MLLGHVGACDPHAIKQTDIITVSATLFLLKEIIEHAVNMLYLKYAEWED